MEWFVALVVVAALGVAAVAAAGKLGEMGSEPVRDTFRQDLADDRPLSADDVARLRFGITLRGYAMNQVDEVLDRLQREIGLRDARIAELSGPLAGGGPKRLDPTPAPVLDPPAAHLDATSPSEPR